MLKYLATISVMLGLLAMASIAIPNQVISNWAIYLRLATVGPGSTASGCFCDLGCDAKTENQSLCILCCLGCDTASERIECADHCALKDSCSSGDPE